MLQHVTVAFAAIIRALSARRGSRSLIALALLAIPVFSIVSPVAAQTGTDHLNSGEQLHRGQDLWSSNRRYVLRMQDDGNLVVYWANPYTMTLTARWSTRTDISLPPPYFDEKWVGNQGDGNLVVYTEAQPYRAMWSSGTPGRGPSTLVMQDDGNLVLYTNTPRVATWSWMTGVIPPSNTPPPSTSEKLSDVQARQMLSAAGIPILSSRNCSDRNTKGCTSFEQVRRATIVGVIAFKQTSGCPVTATAGTEVGHSLVGPYTHWNGYKVDISPTACVTNYILGHYQYIGLRTSDHAPQYQDSAKNVYAHENIGIANDHWDIWYR